MGRNRDNRRDSFEEDLIASANTHQVMAELIETLVVACPEKNGDNQTQEKRLSNATGEPEVCAHGQYTALTVAGPRRYPDLHGCSIGDQCEGSSQNMTMSPVQIGTSGFKCALMMGCPLSGFRPA